MSSGIVQSITFTPPTAGVVTVQCIYQCNCSGSDFGSAAASQAFLTQSNSTSYGAATYAGANMAVQSVQETFPVMAGANVTCGLYGNISGATEITYWNVNIRAEHVKK